jgi:ectoine hydroxylase-related dioxygenase (phytanoyl-CoA dioxygenase family)
MLTQAQKQSYDEQGFVVVESVVSAEELAEIHRVIDDYVERSRAITTHDTIYDLEPGHSAEEPRVRRLKTPLKLHPLFEQIACSKRVLDIAEALLKNGVRLHGSKLNMKSAGYGSPIEWHQDFAFYPHTNDDLLAIGFALDDSTLENGCTLMIPGSHRKPILDHHQEGLFVGGIDTEKQGVDLSQAVPVPLKAGSISIHHCRMLHAAAPNTSPKRRRILFMELAAVDAFPLKGVSDVAQYDSLILRGQPTLTFRCEKMDVRIPQPMPEQQGSIYEIQTQFQPRQFRAT